MKSLLALVCLLVLSQLSPSSAQTCLEEQMLFDSGGLPYEEFGFALAVEGALGVAGSRHDDINGLDSGSAFLFELSSGSELIQFVPSDGAAGDSFGSALAMNATRVVVGAPAASNSEGKAYLFDLMSGNQITALAYPLGAANDRFGKAVAMNDERIIVSASNADNGGLHAGRVLLYDAQSGALLDELRPAVLNSFDNFGVSVDLSQSLAIVGASQEDEQGRNAGTAYVFDLASGQQLHKLLPLDGMAGSFFGSAVAIDGNLAIVGSVFGNAQSSGAAYLFDVATGLQIAKLVPGPAQGVNDGFGQAVGISGSTAIVGALSANTQVGSSGAAFLFDANSGSRLTTLLPSDPKGGGKFGSSVALDGDVGVVGAYRNGASLPFKPGPGVAYVFDTNTSQWTDLGQGLAGSKGTPVLTGCGAVALGANVELQLSGAAPNAPVIAVLGNTEISIPILGGILVPNPGQLIRGLVTDSSGNLKFTSPTFSTAIPSGTTNIIQFWIMDATGPRGYAASNGIRVISR